MLARMTTARPLFVAVLRLDFHPVGFAAWHRPTWLADPDSTAPLAATAAATPALSST
jgi:hypothetical protein